MKMEFDQILKDLRNKIYHPVYFLQGEEPYFIDRISDQVEHNLLTEGEKSFNQTVLYGKDTDLLVLLDVLRRYPMMSNY
jgi:DNA polymerase III subunit delta